jgi:ATP-dependent HslUV protease ATP-binding subunit HslU
VGKTEIARRLAKLTDSPFIKVEATRYTEVGFHGPDVDTIIKDLLENAIQLVRSAERLKNKQKIDRLVEDRLLTALLGAGDHCDSVSWRQHLRDGLLETQKIELELPLKEDNGNMIQKLFGQSPGRLERREVTIAQARIILEESETERLMKTEDLTKEAVRRTEQDGIVFLDEIDKICSPRGIHRSADASAEGVQRDLLPLVEGCSIATKHGPVNTDHILFVASGAFHLVKPSDMMAELQGRLPVRVDLKALSEEDLVRILTEPENNLVRQQVELIRTENVTLTFEPDAVREIAKVAAEANRTVENIGARRLHTVIERIVDDISYEAADMPPNSVVSITRETVRKKVPMLEIVDLARYII